LSSQKQWQTSLLTYPERKFFNLVRNYLGEVQTPFNKHDLIRELSRFLRQSRVQERILALISPADRRILAAVFLLQEPSFESLRLFLEGDLSLFVLDDQIRNMEERLLLFRREDGTLSANPILEHSLRRVAGDGSVLFPSKAVDLPSHLPPFLLSETILLALLSHLAASGSPLRKDGGLRKRDAETLGRIFAFLDERGLEEFLNAAVPLLARCELIDEAGNPRVEHWRRFLQDEPLRRRGKLLAALSDRNRDGGGAARMEAFVRTLAKMNDQAAEARGFEMSTLIRIYRAIDVVSGGTGEHELPVLRLVAVNVLLPADGVYVLHPALHNEPAPGPPPLVQPNFEVTVGPGADPSVALVVALTAEIRSAEAVAVYELTRAGFQRFLDAGGELGGLEKTLEPAALPQNVHFSLEMWQREYRRLSLHSGVVLVADEQTRYLLDHSGALAEFIKARLAEGVYLLDQGEESLWREALQRAGVVHVPQVLPAGSPREDEHALPLMAHALPMPDSLPPLDLSVPANREDGAARSDDDRSAAIQQSLRERLYRLSFSDQERMEIEARIDRRLIVVPSQLRPLRSGVASNEARGLDYIGKIRIIERACQEGSVLEVVHRRSEGEPRRVRLRPQRLDKAGSGLILEGRTETSGETLRLPVSRLGLVRKVFGSLLD
jgi:hypothetical protein